MPYDEVDRVKQLFATFEREGQIEAIFPFLDPEVEWQDNVLTHSTVRGHEGFRTVLADLAEEGYQAQSSPEGYERVAECAVVAHGYTRLVKGSSFTDLPAFWAFEFRGGVVVRGGSASRRVDALAAIGLT